MKRVAKDRGWDDLQVMFENQEIVEVVPYDATEVVYSSSWMYPRLYARFPAGSRPLPRVSGADKDEILQKLGAWLTKL